MTKQPIVGFSKGAKNLKSIYFLVNQMAIAELKETKAAPKATPLKPYLMAKIG